MHARGGELIKIVTIYCWRKHASASFTKARARCDRPFPFGGSPCFLVGAHLPEGALKAVGLEQRIVAEALLAARRPHRDAVDAALEFFHVAVRPGETERGDEMAAPLFGRFRAALDQQRLDFVHGETEILVGSGPARRMNAGLAAERIDHQAAVVGKGGAAGRFRRGHRLDARIFGEGLAGFRRLGEPEFAGRLRFDTEGRQQFAHFGELAGIMRGDDDGAGEMSARLVMPGLCWASA